MLSLKVKVGRITRGGCVLLGAVFLVAGCAPGRSGGRPPGTPGARAAAAMVPAVTTIAHWGSFFGGTPGNVDTRPRPVPAALPGTVAEVGSSNSTEYALLTNGTLYAWGLGSQGQLGDGRLANSLARPVRVRFPAGVRIASIPTDAMPFDTALALDTRGRAWGWGYNGGGELCLGSDREYATPVRLPFSGVTALAGASTHALYDARGTVYACGQNIDGDLGTGSSRGSSVPAKVAGLRGQEVSQLVASFGDSGALLADGSYYDWGYNGLGQLGDGRAGRGSDVPVRVPLPHPVAEVAQGGSIWGNGQTLVRLSDGSLYAWGDDHAGQLGTGGSGLRPAPVRFYPPPGVSYASLATGSATSYAISTTGQVYAWGVGYEGQLGDGHDTGALVPVLVSSWATGISATANNVVINGRPGS